jgi:hypothetical protein
MRVLLLCNYDPYNAAMVSDHINAFPMYSKHEVIVFSHLVSNNGDLPGDVPLHQFDVVIVHYSVFLAIDAYLSNRTRNQLREFQGVKAIFLQDEYRFVDATVQNIKEVGFDVIFTCVPAQSIERVYPAAKLPGVTRINVLTGYVSESLLHYTPIPISKRKFDVSYRGRRYPVWHGRLGLEKWRIAQKFLEDAPRFRLRCNISYEERDRVYGAGWVDLLQQSKAVLGVESGASIFDFTGEVSSKVDTLVALQDANELSYDLLRERYFAQIEDTIPLAQISPRTFEAIALRTLCVLYEGEYSGVLQPWRHYVPLKKDHSNMAEVVAVIRDPSRISEIVATAYAEIALNPKYSYKAFIAQVDGVLEREHFSKQTMNTPEISPEIRQSRANGAVAHIRRKYPFYLIRNPHNLIARPRLAIRILSRIKAALPFALVRQIKAAMR